MADDDGGALGAAWDVVKGIGEKVVTTAAHEVGEEYEQAKAIVDIVPDAGRLAGDLANGSSAQVHQDLGNLAADGTEAVGGGVGWDGLVALSRVINPNDPTPTWDHGGKQVFADGWAHEFGGGTHEPAPPAPAVDPAPAHDGPDIPPPPVDETPTITVPETVITSQEALATDAGAATYPDDQYSAPADASVDSSY